MSERSSTRLDRKDDPGTLADMPGPRTDPQIPDLVNLTEAAEILAVAKSRAHVLVQEGRLPGLKVGGTWVFRRALVEELRPKIGKRTTE
jgi:excisionase family DNA binding protein